VLLQGARRENILYGSSTDEQRSSSAKDPATRRAVFWRAPGCVAPQSESAAAILPRRALPAARQKTAHPFPILIWVLTVIISLAFVPATRAMNSEILVTPTNLVTLLYSFSVSTNATDRGVAFHVTVTHRRFDIYPDSKAELGTIEYKEITNSMARPTPGPLKVAYFNPLKPRVRIALKKEKRVWTADFNASHELLKNTNVCFVFSVPGQQKSKNEADSAPPATDLYELKLHDFAKPSN